MLIPVILAGGIGTRLWPLSRASYPKQLLALIGEKSLLQSVVSFVLEIPTVKHIIIVCAQQHHLLIKQQLYFFEKTFGVTFIFILEPLAKNTAPAITLAALYAEARFKENIDLLVLPSDHILKDTKKIIAQIRTLKKFVDEKKMVLFGIKPSYPETGYGYIETGIDLQTEKVLLIKSFTEKPNLDIATKYCQNDHYYWNSGMFYFQHQAYLQEVKRIMPSIFDTCSQAFDSHAISQNDIYINLSQYQAVPNISIDYAVMTKTDQGVLAILDTEWIDVGSWYTISTLGQKDQHGNTTIGDVAAHNCENSYLRAESRLLAAVGIKNHIIVETADAVLVVAKSHAQEVKNLVEQLTTNKRPETKHHSKSNQAWGFAQTIYDSNEYSLQQLTIYPHTALLQRKYEHHTLHWVVQNGTAEFIFGADKSNKIIYPSQSIDIKKSEDYQIINRTDSLLSILKIKFNHNTEKISDLKESLCEINTRCI